MVGIYERAVVKWGETAQLDMLIEEMAELTKAICKFKRGEENYSDIAEEQADVEIMLTQLVFIMNTHTSRYDDFVAYASQDKLERLEKRLK